MKKYILFLFLAAAFLSGCVSSSAKSAKSGPEITVNHEIKYSNEGTKSEGRSGYLKINGMTIPDCFTQVVAEGKVYTFRSKKTKWGDDGYFPLEGKSAESVYPPVNKNITDADLSRGWSEVTGRYLNVPSHWIFVKWEKGSAVSAPDKIDLLVKTKSLETLPRNKIFSERKLK